ncbi:hypothetical protein [Parasphingorhabdus sp.]|uniref:hypothetical protein n=1 Tax=Parasphingorhabdus sp. TaxID=2709688 RepID=UPI003A901225
MRVRKNLARGDTFAHIETMQPFSDAEIELFIETNGRLSAERALALGTEFVRFIEAQFAEGELEAIEIVHLGRGSFSTRLMVILRDQATSSTIALAALALSAANILKEDSDGFFATETAKACIESGAARCGFRTSQEEFFVERSAMPAAAKLQSLAMESAGPFSKEFSSAFAGGRPQASTAPRFVGSEPSLSAEYEPPQFDVVGVLDRNDGVPRVYTVDGSYDIELGEGSDAPAENRLADFNLRGPLKKYGRTYAVEGWVLRNVSPLATFVGRMIEIHDGRAVTFETTEGARYAPVVPDDTIGWVPMGQLVEVKAVFNDDELLEIYDWRELDREEAASISPPATRPELSTYSGVLSEGVDGLHFKLDWGGTALVNGFADGLNLPRDRPIEIRAELSRGSRGGMADPRLFIHSWRPFDNNTVAEE